MSRDWVPMSGMEIITKFGEQAGQEYIKHLEGLKKYETNLDKPDDKRLWIYQTYNGTSQKHSITGITGEKVQASADLDSKNAELVGIHIDELSAAPTFSDFSGDVFSSVKQELDDKKRLRPEGTPEGDEVDEKELKKRARKEAAEAKKAEAKAAREEEARASKHLGLAKSWAKSIDTDLKKGGTEKAKPSNLSTLTQKSAAVPVIQALDDLGKEAKQLQTSLEAKMFS